MEAAAAIQSNHQRIVVRLDAVELNENKLTCEVSNPPRLRTGAGVEYSVETAKVLCISGMATARRRLRLPNGLAITVSEISGIVDDDEEAGVCRAIAIAIARALNKDPSLLYDSMENWQLTV